MFCFIAKIMSSFLINQYERANVDKSSRIKLHFQGDIVFSPKFLRHSLWCYSNFFGDLLLKDAIGCSGHYTLRTGNN